MDSQKEHLHEEAQTASSATYTTVNNIYGLAFQHCTFHDATFQTLVQGAEGERESAHSCKGARKTTSSAGAEKAASLHTPEARILMERLVEAGLLDADWQPVALSNAEKGVLASLLARRLDIPNLWQVFGSLWGMKPETLRTACNKGMDQRRTAEFMERVKGVMEG